MRWIIDAILGRKRFKLLHTTSPEYGDGCSYGQVTFWYTRRYAKTHGTGTVYCKPDGTQETIVPISKDSWCQTVGMICHRKEKL